MKARPVDQIELLPQGNIFWHDFSAPYTDLPDMDGFDDDVETVEELTTSDPSPFFEDTTNTANITTQLGSNIYLHCRVNDLRGKTVSWKGVCVF